MRNLLKRIAQLFKRAAPKSKKATAGLTAIAVSAAAFIGPWEGLRTTAYPDALARNIPTVCYGETRGVKRGDTYTDAQCAAMLQRGLVTYRDGLHEYFTPETKGLRLTPERDAAYVSLAYNAGIRGIGRSTAVRRLNDGDIVGGCKALQWWNKAGKRIIRGLVNRRADEHALCMVGVNGA